ncbi:MAG: TRAP transporter substrate-binding protein [Oscillospiraceae bacterium]|nr:TRAP transporter substrate-binding protein [Oscillospiraceae bacterium]
MKKILALILASSLSFAMLSGCTTPPAVTPDAPDGSPAQDVPSAEGITLTLAEVHAEDYPTTLGDLEFARLVEERSEGRIKVDVRFAGVLGSEEDVLDSLTIGSLDFGRVSLSPVSQHNSDLNVLMLPYIYRDANHMWAVLNGEIGAEIMAGIESAGLVGLTWYDAGARNFYAREPIPNAESLRGLKVRVQANPLMQGIVSALGANPVSMALGEVYPALSTGTVDAAENSIPSYESTSHYEVAPYMLVSEHTRVPEILLASKQVMDGLSQEDRDIIMQAAKDSQTFQIEKWREREEESLEKMEANENFTIYELDDSERQIFVDAMAGVVAEHGAGNEELIERIRNT